MIERVLTLEQLAALGKVVAEAARIERTVDAFLRGLTNLSPTQYEAFNQGKMMLGRKLEVLEVVWSERLRTKSKRDALKSLLSRIKSLNKDRVAYVHGRWDEPPLGRPATEAEFWGFGREPSGSGFVILKEGKGSRKLTAAKLEATAKQLQEATLDLHHFWGENWIAPRIKRQSARLKSKQDRASDDPVHASRRRK